MSRRIVVREKDYVRFRIDGVVRPTRSFERWFMGPPGRLLLQGADSMTMKCDFDLDLPNPEDFIVDMYECERADIGDTFIFEKSDGSRVRYRIGPGDEGSEMCVEVLS